MNLDNMITMASEMVYAKEGNERIESAVTYMVQSIQGAKNGGMREAIWNVPDDLDYFLKDEFKKKGYSFKNVPYRPGFWGQGEYITW